MKLMKCFINIHYIS